MRGSGIGLSKLSLQSPAQGFQFFDLIGHGFPSLGQIKKLIPERRMLNKCSFSPAPLRMGATGVSPYLDFGHPRLPGFPNSLDRKDNQGSSRIILRPRTATRKGLPRERKRNQQQFAPTQKFSERVL